MRFDYPWLLLIFLLAVPVLWLWLRSARKRQERLRRFADSGFIGKVLLGNRPGLRRMHFILFFVACILLTAAVTVPKYAGGKEKITISGIDVMVVMDVSNSMRATDLQPSRLDRAKLALQKVLSTMTNDRIGIVVFAGHPYVTLPIADDPNAAQMMISSISTENVGDQGTAIGDAITLAADHFPEEAKNKDRGRAIIVITDGENHEDDAVEAAKKAAENGVIVCTIGIGTPEGGMIPEFDEKGTFIANKKDRSGKEIVTKLNESMLKEIAKQGQGVYVRSTQADAGVSSVYSKLQGLTKASRDVYQLTDFIQLFPWLAALALLLLLIEPLLPDGNRNEDKPIP